jgi:3-hydroxyisobutyrate dehydrogenase
MEDIKNQILNQINQKLLSAVNDRNSNYHLMVVANIDEDGFPTARTVVNRFFDPENRIVCFHTDIRSPKIKELQKNDNISLVLYDPREKLQVKMQAKAVINYKNELSQKRWKETRYFSRECYLLKNPPSSKVKEHELWDFSDEDLQSDKGYETFTVIQCFYYQIDALFLHHQGHKRYLFNFNKDKISFDLIAP